MNDKKKIEEEAENKYPMENLTTAGYVITTESRAAFIAGANFGMGLKDEWISVKDRLPEKFVNVLGYGDNDKIAIVCIDNTGEFDRYNIGDEDEKVTHWHPLPSPPKKTP